LVESNVSGMLSWTMRTPVTFSGCEA